MTRAPDRSSRRAERLLSAYPPAWRSRYGDEFKELLIAEFEDSPRSWRRTLDVIASAGLTRLKSAGLVGQLPDPSERVQKSLALLWVAAAAFFVFGAAMWSQIVVGWRWHPPTEHAVAVAMVLMSAMVVFVAGLAALAVVPMLWAYVRAVRRRQRGLLPATALSTVGAAMVVIGSSHFARGWPGTGGQSWGYHELAHPGIGSFIWAATRGVTSYWMHPSALASFPAAEVAWMAVSPLAIVFTVVGFTKVIRRLELSPRAWRYEAGLARAGASVMFVFLVAAGYWVLAGGAPGPTGIYRVGTIDFLSVVIMGSAWMIARRAAAQARDAGAVLAAQAG